MVYSDEYENNNPLGSHKGLSKCLGIYAQIPCLPPEYIAKVENIFLFILLNSLDYKIFKNEKVFQKMISELKYLRDEGVSIVDNEGK